MRAPHPARQITEIDPMSSAQNSGDLASEIEDLVLANHILHAEGVVDSFGHVSFRSPERPDRFFMASAMAPGQVTAADIMEFDSEGEPVDRKGRSIYSERFIHSEVYKKRADVNSVIHSHSPGVIPFSVTDVPLRAVMLPAFFLNAGVPVFEIRDAMGMTDMLVKDAKRGKALADCLGEHSVGLLRGHGDVVVGPNLRVAVSRAIYTEANARIQMQAVMLASGGRVEYMAAEECALRNAGAVNEKPGSGHGTDRVWEALKSVLVDK
jgi:ribulose-5-phosphate 4-epimerase/fuculose-1-phosphate aldolase